MCGKDRASGNIPPTGRWPRGVALAAAMLALSGAAALSQPDPEQIARALSGASEAERAAIIAELAPHGEAAVDALLHLMGQGELDQRIALQAIARIQSGDVAPADPTDDTATPAADDGAPTDRAPESQAEAGEIFAAHPGFTVLDPQAAQNRLIDSLEGDAASVFLPGQWLGPLTTAILLLEAEEGALPHVRYRLSYGEDQLPSGPGGGTVSVSYVEVTRFNLGPARHAEIAEAAGDVPVAPAEHFGIGPHVSLRLVTRPIQGRSTDLIGLSRAEISEDDAAAQRCLGQSCLSTAPLAEAALGADWGAMETVSPGAFDPPYAALRDGAHSPAATVDLMTREGRLAGERGGEIAWDGFEFREGVGPMEPFAEAMVEAGLGQDSAVDAVLREGHVMDHTVEAVWHRLVSIGGADPSAPQLFGTQAFEHRSGQN